MDRQLRNAFTALLRLDSANARSAMTSCKICKGAAEFFDVSDFNKCVGGYPFGPSGIRIDWYRCCVCSFIFTKFFDDWTREDFTNFIYNDDYIKVDGEYLGARPKRTAVAIAQMLHGHEDLSVLDYGSGAGLFAQEMAQRGFLRVQSYDPFASPTRPSGPFDVLSCIEVVEHSPDPLGTLRDMASLLTPDGAVILGTGLQPPEIGTIRTNWWYAAPRNGHVSLYSDSALAIAAGRVGLRFHRGGLHALTSGTEGLLADLAERCVGAPLFFANLGAPRAGSHPGWHPVEPSARGPFRWTAATQIAWIIDLPRGHWRLQVRVTTYNQATTGSCTMTVNGEKMAVRKENNGFVGESGTTVAGRSMIILHTPELYSPHERTGSPDKRRLGLAIPIVDPASLAVVGNPTDPEHGGTQATLA